MPTVRVILGQVQGQGHKVVNVNDFILRIHAMWGPPEAFSFSHLLISYCHLKQMSKIFVKITTILILIGSFFSVKVIQQLNHGKTLSFFFFCFIIGDLKLVISGSIFNLHGCRFIKLYILLLLLFINCGTYLTILHLFSCSLQFTLNLKHYCYTTTQTCKHSWILKNVKYEIYTGFL